MSALDKASVAALQVDPHRIRNLCIIAHVDHGKTTLSDSLVSSNGIIPERLAGKVRFLDSREDEQRRGITMESSAISLVFHDERKNKVSAKDGATTHDSETTYLINLIDSPGHIDFSPDVSTAVRLCDGALIVVDVLEGVCAQTTAVLRQAWQEGVRPVLVLNKIDRLILERQSTPVEAYDHLRRIIEQVNAVMSTMYTSEVMRDTQTFEEEREASILFDPVRNNVVFASAFDCWGFSLRHFAQICSKRLQIPAPQLRRALWGNFYLSPKTRKIVKNPANSKSKPLFVQCVLDPIWTVYNSVILDPKPELVAKIVKSQNLVIQDRDLRHKDRRITLQAIMRSWLPVSNAVLRMAVDCLPSPCDAQRDRSERLLQSSSTDHKQTSDVEEVRAAVANCRGSDDDPVVVYISKMMTFDQDQSKEHLGQSRGPVGFGRVFSGVLRANTPVYVLGPKYVPRKLVGGDQCPEHALKFDDQLTLFMIMGTDLMPLDEVPAGNIVGIGGLGTRVLKSATLSSTLACPSFANLTFQAVPVLRVAVEPETPTDLPQLQEGLRLLYHADPGVEIMAEETGELMIIALGELHLEQCLKDLRERFARVPILVSPPLISFRETVALGISDSSQSDVEVLTSDKSCKVVVDARSLPESIVGLLEANRESIREMSNKQSTFEQYPASAAPVEDFTTKFRDALQACGPPWANLHDRILAFGPRSCGPNILVNMISDFDAPSETTAVPSPAPGTANQDGTVASDRKVFLDMAMNSMITGFQLATKAGPLCEEPLWGVAFFVKHILEITTTEGQEEEQLPNEEQGQTRPAADGYSGLSGQLISTCQSACRKACENAKLRLVEAMYACELQCDSEQVGRLYGVLSKRLGRVIDETLLEGSSTFTIKAVLPVVESFGLAQELLHQSHGEATTPQLIWSHWERIEDDPFFQPESEAEREELGEVVYEQNRVRGILDDLRRRKGLAVDDKVVVFAEKQRTRSKKK